MRSIEYARKVVVLMAVFKTLYIFRSGGNGWSELWYQDRSQFDECIQPAKNVAAKRALMLGTGAKLTHVRISSVDRPRKSHVFKVNPDWNSSATVADTPWNTIYARASDSTRVYHRVVQISGVPDNWIERSALTDEFDAFTPAAIAAISQFRASLVANDHRFAQRSGEGAAGTLSNVTAFDKQAGTNRLTAAVVGFPGLPGSFVTFSEVTGFGASTLAKGTHKIVNNTGTLLVLETVVPDDILPAAWSAGKVRPKTTGYFTPAFMEAQRESHRDRGRRFFVTRGRRSKRRA